MSYDRYGTATREALYCGRCNARIWGQTFTCCEIVFHGQCFTRHRQQEHAT